jgi:hypothetical protein
VRRRCTSKGWSLNGVFPLQKIADGVSVAPKLLSDFGLSYPLLMQCFNCDLFVHSEHIDIGFSHLLPGVATNIYRCTKLFFNYAHFNILFNN